MGDMFSGFQENRFWCCENPVAYTLLIEMRKFVYYCIKIIDGGLLGCACSLLGCIPTFWRNILASSVLKWGVYYYWHWLHCGWLPQPVHVGIIPSPVRASYQIWWSGVILSSFLSLITPVHGEEGSDQQRRADCAVHSKGLQALIFSWWVLRSGKNGCLPFLQSIDLHDLLLLLLHFPDTGSLIQPCTS